MPAGDRHEGEHAITRPTDNGGSVDETAAYWLAQIEGHGATPEQQRRFERWLNADLRNRRSYDRLNRTWRDIGTLGHLADLAPLGPAPAPAAALAAGTGSGRADDRSSFSAGAGVRAGRRYGVMAALAAGVAALVLVPVLRPQAGESYETALGHSRTIALADGSRIALAPGSALRVRMDGSNREVTLTRGEAFFQIAHDAKRPFVVHAAETLIRDVGTSFDVNLTRETVRVAVREGQVDVHRAGSAPRSLRGGQALQLARAPGAVPLPSAVVPTSPDNPGAWRTGRLTFDDVRLADLAADANRYYPGGIRLTDPAVGDLRVTASFRPDQIPTFFAALGDSLPVRTATASDGTITIRPVETPSPTF